MKKHICKAMHHTLQMVPYRRHTDEFQASKMAKEHIIKRLTRDVEQNQREQAPLC